MSGVKPDPRFEALSPLRTKHRHDLGICFDPWSFDEINAVGNDGENGFEVLFDRLGTSGEIHDEGGAPYARGLAGQNSGGHVVERGGSHQFAEAWEHFVTDGGGGLRSDIADRWAGATGGDDEGAVFIIGHAFEFGFDQGLLVRDDCVYGVEGGRQPFS